MFASQVIMISARFYLVSLPMLSFPGYSGWLAGTEMCSFSIQGPIGEGSGYEIITYDDGEYCCEA